MLYAIVCEDTADSLEKRLSARPAHISRLQELQNAGRLLLAGPHPAVDSDNPDLAGFTGSLIIAEFDSLQDAQQWANADPYREAEVYARVSVKPFKKIFPQ
ncbi:putative enzyme [Candidatus Methylobacter favarea]|uniref:Putative enzyme n=1 Tax=Candidatus Methylobacter favarea TaxID=2707345 RepID=A0A8S0Y5J1_9GAMM|nr:YciI family protein [Candidatus Methylobacter favarea]CAA9888835.1 putative enzyme [Candidatus Methylobacter favarea]